MPGVPWDLPAGACTLYYLAQGLATAEPTFASPFDEVTQANPEGLSSPISGASPCAPLLLLDM